ncbi:MAG: HAD family phosphatase [Phycisphaerales bacterium]
MPGAIFDLDGTLVDSFQAHWHAWHAMCARHGVVLTHERFVRSFGMRNDRIVEMYWREDGHEPPDAAGAERCAHEKEELYRRAVEHDFPAMPGGRELLLRLRAAGWRLAVGTSGPPENLELALRGLRAQELFDARVCGLDVARGKPAPDIFLRAAELLGLPPSECVVVEDAVPGIEAAHAAGMPCAAIVSAGHTHAELAGAELRFDRFDELSEPALRALLAPSARGTGAAGRA